MRTDLPAGIVTLLFTDIEGSTKLLTKLGDAYGELLEHHRRIVRDAIAAHNGVEVETEGDAFFVSYPDAADAVRSSFAAQLDLAAQPWPEGSEIRVRMGLHTGEVKLSGGGYIGLAVHHAARVASTGHGGQVVVSQETLDAVGDLLPDGATFRPLGVYRLKDIEEDQRLFQLCHPSLRAEFPPLKSLDLHGSNLPEDLTSFVGREEELEEVKRLLESSRLVTLTGSGGCGKTRLALRAAADAVARFTSGAWFVDLAPVTAAEAVVPTIAAVFGLREDEGSAEGGLRERLQAYLQPRQVLMVLDNCEHVIAEAADLANTLLKGCPDVSILATSREALGVLGEAIWMVPSLRMPDPRSLPPLDELALYPSIQLFVERASLRREYRLTEADAPHVAQICFQLDGIPLAIELAAGKARMMTPQQIASKLDDRFKLLTGGGRASIARQQTLLAAVEWSHDLLSEPERCVLRRLSVFAGGFGFEAAEPVAAGDGVDDGSVLEHLEQLVEKSLVVADTTGQEIRFRLLETIRQYAAVKLVDAGESGDAHAHHQHWYAELAASVEEGLLGPGELEWLRRIDDELDNVRAATRWPGDLGLQIAGDLWHYWMLRGNWAEPRALLELALVNNPEAEPQRRLVALAALTELTLKSEGAGPATQWLEDAMALAEGLTDGRSASVLSRLLVLSAQQTEDLDERGTILEHAVEQARRSTAPHTLGWALLHLAANARQRGELDQARALLEEAEPVVRACGARSLLCEYLFRAATVQAVSGHAAEADVKLEPAMAEAQALGNAGLRCSILRTRAAIAQILGDPGREQRLLEEAHEIASEAAMESVALQLGNLLAYAKAANDDIAGARVTFEGELERARRAGIAEEVASLTHGLAELNLLAGDIDRARVLLEDAERQGRELDHADVIQHAVHDLGTIAAIDGDYATAAARYGDALTTRRHSLRQVVVQSLSDISALALATGKLTEAARMAGALEAWCEESGAEAYPHLASRAEEVAAAVKSAADPSVWADGRALDIDSALDEAAALCATLSAEP